MKTVCSFVVKFASLISWDLSCLPMPPCRVAIAPAGSSYVFDASGQFIDLGGLLCLCDADGPCGNPVKDAQRAKTDANTTQTLTIIWATNAIPGVAERAATWYRALLKQMGAATMDVEQARN